ncbi:MAG: glycosyltransferase family 2 protein [Bryobacteraceae bacterium]
MQAQANGYPVTIVVPCFNEQESLPVLIPRLEQLVGEHPSWDVLFVNDGSSDSTKTILDRAEREYGWVRALHHHDNRGLGAAIRTGFEYVSAPVMCTIDCDCTYPPERIPDLIDGLLRGAHIVTASPWHPKAENGDVTPLRKALSQATSRVYGVLLGQRIHTFTSMFRAYRRQSLACIPFLDNGFPAVTEILIKGLLIGLRVEEVPMPLGARKQGVSKINLGRAIQGHLALMWRCFYWRFTSNWKRRVSVRSESV